MQKKIMAVAVAGALAAPVAAQAQVTIYGLFIPSVEMRSATGADNQTAAQAAAGGNISSFRTAASFTATPADRSSRLASQSAGSNLGFRVREDLGGGMYAGGQIEYSFNVGNMTPAQNIGGGHFSTFRNTAGWIGGNWGEFKLGIWDTPFTVNMGTAVQHVGYSNPSVSMAAGVIGALSVAQSVVSSMSLAGFCNIPTQVAGAANTDISMPNTAAQCLGGATTFGRREPNSVQYWTPNMNGFQARIVYGQDILKGDATGSGAGATPNTLKPQLIGFSAGWSGMGINATVGYEEHKDYTAFASRALGGVALGGIAAGGAGQTQSTVATLGTAASPMTSSKDTGINFNINYTIAGQFSVGFYYEQLKYKASYGGVAPVASDVTSLDRPAWRIDGAWRSGAHAIGAQYGTADDIECTSVANACDGKLTGVTGLIVGYAYFFSKRTQLAAYATMIDNDVNARTSGIVFGGIATASGADPKYYGILLRHSF